ncbi:hypothetical protein [Kyrpidia spormannii]|uniref:hypothetical protein n=1 Tax=Kyrpidia spormannii TaxID=2055160 RepID=UPI0010555BB6|nr:hypothetical protein [Kyrpidia spormannii]
MRFRQVDPARLTRAVQEALTQRAASRDRVAEQVRALRFQAARNAHCVSWILPPASPVPDIPVESGFPGQVQDTGSPFSSGG